MSRITTLWISLTVLFAFAGGAVAGGTFINDRWQHYYAQRAQHESAQIAQEAELGEARDKSMGRLQAQVAGFSQALAACQQNFSAGTLLYETPPAAAVATGIREILGRPVNITPGSNVAPRWWIPAKIKPQLYGANGGAVYYYLGQENKVDGPYLPMPAVAGQP